MPKEYSIASCRVSTPEQEENKSLPRQKANVINASIQLGAPIIETWSGSMSSKRGTNINRPDIKEMIAFCKKNTQVKYLIVDEPDRFMRSIYEGIYFEETFRQLDVKVWYASDPALNGDDLSAKMMKFSKYFAAEGSNDERIRKSINGQTTALQSGMYPFSPKPGYMKGRSKGVQEIHPVTGPALREVLIRISEHAVTPTQGLIELNKSLYTQERKPIRMDKFRKIATDPFYAGIIEINKQVSVRNENGLHERLITLEQHQELVRVLDSKKKNQSGPRKNGNPDFPLNAITAHDTCLELTSKGKFVGFKHSNGKNKELVYEKYRCRSCKFYLSRDELHKKVMQLFESAPLTKEGNEDFLEALKIVWKKKEAQARQDGVRLSQKVDGFKDEIATRALAAIKPENSSIKDEILASIEKTRELVSEMEEELSALNQKTDEDKKRFLKFALNFVSNMGENFLTILPENRAKCKQIIFPAGFYMDAGKNVYTPEISPLIRLAGNKKAPAHASETLLVRVQGLKPWTSSLARRRSIN